MNLSKKYDELYQRGGEIIERHGNPCLPTETGSCQHPFMHFCCGVYCGDKHAGCMYLEKDGRRKIQGCTVESLYCKVWLCGHLRKKYPELNEEMELLRHEVFDIFPDCVTGYAKDYVLENHKGATNHDSSF